MAPPPLPSARGSARSSRDAPRTSCSFPGGRSRIPISTRSRPWSTLHPRGPRGGGGGARRFPAHESHARGEASAPPLPRGVPSDETLLRGLARRGHPPALLPTQLPLLDSRRAVPWLRRLTTFGGRTTFAPISAENVPRLTSWAAQKVEGPMPRFGASRDPASSCPRVVDADGRAPPSPPLLRVLLFPHRRRDP